jgi:hypothetical protein
MNNHSQYYLFRIKKTWVFRLLGSPTVRIASHAITYLGLGLGLYLRCSTTRSWGVTEIRQELLLCVPVHAPEAPEIMPGHHWMTVGGQAM